MVRRSKADAEQTRSAILDAAEHQFYQHGVSRTTLAHIASAAGVTRGAIYWHFDNKADLFNAMLDRIRLPFRQMLSELQSANDLSALAQIKDVMHRALVIVQQDPQYHRVLTVVFHRCEYVDELNPAVQQQEQLNQEVQDTLTLAFARALENGELNPAIEPRVAAAAMNSLVGGLISKFLQHPGYIDLIEQAQALLDTLFLGIKKPD
ncbi:MULTISPECIES: TetR family transcriptional regulator [Pseudoalteromonas]|uniref:TetR family transcriptional regulator n=1 Tax=Pseudoalteromonas ruthenica TaxID=151081 RepID=A0A0F4Q1Y3_9GAMM|nr:MULTISPECIES: TetR family transcriptional regulator [Pseudoalteromonas]KJY98972.1 TetR family transcriptional regulator [Pseudoalteromonas ruthenica]KJZ01370.1 TetR family transcriptional regulator [Pseudoalteromonas ruthenica]MCF2861780.1 TetR family transcriptional regulator [Pseudoalteromonas sp. CNAT2-18]MCG7557181.1 TetR family transcriptional regulator [Pseudoalteromonas sp. CNAT2-18.1]MCG7568909.1 TetR family transcriptional regulator [Pseudoalteromonas sp. CNC9-20]|tara:strand:- start:391 stop:1011 length:621 start_codon:yes stop_codon:yes gene_type:complete